MSAGESVPAVPAIQPDIDSWRLKAYDFANQQLAKPTTKSEARLLKGTRSTALVDTLVKEMREACEAENPLLLPLPELSQGELHKELGDLAKAVVKQFKAPAPQQKETSDGKQSEDGENIRGWYAEYKGRFYYIKDSGQWVPLNNFTARILADLRIDDGTDVIRREYEISAAVNKQEVEMFRLPASKFDRLDWYADNLGAGATINVVSRAKDHIAAAIREFSDKHEKRHIFTHTGWRKIDGKWVYLHGGGGIDESGLRTDVLVEIGRECPPLRAFVLPAPIVGPELIDVIHVELQFLELGPLTVSGPVWSAIWRLVIDWVDFSLHIDGETGTFKTELATLAMQHFGADFNSRALPASWHNTANANEAIAFILKDALDVIDDFKPIGGAVERQRMHADADKLLRAAGNRAGRGRLNSDSSMRAAKPPRGTIISTGEETPGGGSLNARLWVTEVQKGMIDKAKLTTAQSMALSGFYTQCASSFLSWLASRRVDVLKEMRTRLPALRKKADLMGHPRTPGVVGDLHFGAEIFFRFATEVGAVTAKEAEDHLGGIWNALLEVSKTRNSQIREQESSRRFLELFNSAIAAGKAHLINGDDGPSCPPYNPENWGWRIKTVGAGKYEREEWQPQGNCVGWINRLAARAPTMMFISIPLLPIKLPKEWRAA